MAQFTAKITNSEKTICFLSLMSCSINKLKSVFRFYVEISDALIGFWCFFLIACCNIIRVSWETKKEDWVTENDS